MWLKLDDSMSEHPKFTRYEDDFDLCFSTFVQMGLYCSRNLTDGVIAKRDERRFDPRAVKRLLEPFGDDAGPCERGKDGRLIVHDFLDYNPSREQVMAKRDADRDRQAKSRKVSQRDSRRESERPVPVLDLDPIPKETSPCLYGVPPEVLGYFESKCGREATDADATSLRVLVKKYGPGIVNQAIGQAVVQGDSADNFALVTTIAKAEAKR